MSLFAVVATSAAAQPALPTGQPSVSVVEFEDLAHSGQAAAFRQMVQSALTATGKFRVFAENTAQLQRRQARANAGTFTSRTPGRNGGFQGADYLVTGSITSAAQERRAGGIGSFIGRTIANTQTNRQNEQVNCARMVTTLAVDINVVDSRSGENVFAGRINQQDRSATSCSNDPQANLATILRTTADGIAQRLVTNIFPIQVLMTQPDGTIMLNFGEGSVSVGQILNIYGPRTRVPDPAGGSIMVDGQNFGRIRVTEVTPRFSRARALTSLSGSPPAGSVARPVVLTPQEIRAMEQEQRRQQRGTRR